MTDDIFKHKYLKYLYKRKQLEQQFGGAILNQCENTSPNRHVVSLFDLKLLSEIGPNAINDYTKYVNHKKKYNSAHNCHEHNRKKLFFINNEIGRAKKISDVKKIESLREQLTNVTTEKTNICDFLKNYSKNKQTNIFNDFMDETYQQILKIKNIYEDSKSIPIDENMQNNLLFNVIGSYLNLSCDSDFLERIINSGKRIYLIDFMNFCNMLKNKKTESENLTDLIMNFFTAKLKNGDHVIVVFKNGCIDESIMMARIKENKLHLNLNSTFHFITANSAGNIDDYIFWILGTYFFNRLHYLGMSDNLFLMTEDRQSLSDTPGDISTNIKNLLNFTKSSDLSHNPNEIKFYEYDGVNDTVVNRENATLVAYFNIFDLFLTVRNVDLLTIHQLEELIIRKLLNRLLEYHHITIDQIVNLVENFVSPGLIFYTLIKFAQYHKYGQYDGSIDRNDIYTICKNPNFQYVFDKNTRRYVKKMESTKK